MNYAALRYAIEQSPVEGAAWQVLVVIAYRADRVSGCCIAGQRTLAREARIARSTVQHAVAELVGRGIVEIVVEGTGHRSTTYRVVGHLEDPPPVHKPAEPFVDRRPVHTEPVDNPVADRQVTGSGPIVNLVVDRWAGPSIGRREKRREDLEGTSATASSVDDDPTADAVVVHSPNGKVDPALDPGLSEATRTSLAALKASIHDRLTADRQAERDRARDLLGPPTTEPQETL